MRPNFVSLDDIRTSARDEPLADVFRSIGKKRLSDAYVEQVLGMPLHLRFACESRIDADEPLDDETFASIPFHSLCKGLFLPLSMLQPDMVAHYFQLQALPPPDAAAREALVGNFLRANVGLTLVQKLACILGDPFQGRRSTFKRDSMISLLLTTTLEPRKALIERLAQPGVGDVSVLFAERRPAGKQEAPLTSSEVLEALRFLPDAPRALKFGVLRSLYLRMGKLEAYFFAKLLLRKAAFGFDYQGPLLARAIAEAFSKPNAPIDAEQVAHAVALTDYFKVAKILEQDGPLGLRKIQLQPLVPIRPALASQGDSPITKFPVWVERKYDGIRLMLHKSTDAAGNILVGAFTRTRGDWLEDIRGLDATIRAIPARNFIIDGELHGTVIDIDGDGKRPANVYDILQVLGDTPQRPVRFKYTAFDVIYANGQDLTQMPLKERRQRLQMLIQPLVGAPTPIPVDMSDGQQCVTIDDVNRLFQYFRGQGYEGIIAKDFDGTYKIASRDPSWVKRKPLETLDLVLLGGVFAVTTKDRAGMFGSYVIAARRPDGSFQDVGDVAGLDVERDAIMQQTIVREGLITGRRLERASTSGVRPGLELRPHIVVTVKCEGIVRENVFKDGDYPYSLRDPKIVHIRADKSAHEADTTKMIEDMYRKERLG